MLLSCRRWTTNGVSHRAISLVNSTKTPHLAYSAHKSNQPSDQTSFKSVTNIPKLLPFSNFIQTTKTKPKAARRQEIFFDRGVEAKSVWRRLQTASICKRAIFWISQLINSLWIADYKVTVIERFFRFCAINPIDHFVVSLLKRGSNETSNAS